MFCHPIAHIETDFATKFGVPRQAGLIPELEGRIIFEPPYRDPEALRGLDGYSHLWLIWEFSEVTSGPSTSEASTPLNSPSTSEASTSEASTPPFRPTVRPPRLGGNVRMGVFATRSPFRPNPIGLSSVQISRIELHTAQGPVIHVQGADLMDGTPILDIKPYLPFTDSHPDALGGFTQQTREQPQLQVIIPPAIEQHLLHHLGPQRLQALRQVLSQDPRPHYQHDPLRIYGLPFAGLDLHFRVEEGKVVVVE